MMVPRAFRNVLNAECVPLLSHTMNTGCSSYSPIQKSQQQACLGVTARDLVDDLVPVYLKTIVSGVRRRHCARHRAAPMVGSREFCLEVVLFSPLLPACSYEHVAAIQSAFFPADSSYSCADHQAEMSGDTKPASLSPRQRPPHIGIAAVQWAMSRRGRVLVATVVLLAVFLGVAGARHSEVLLDFFERAESIGCPGS